MAGDKNGNSPFFMDDGPEGAEKANRSLATFELHACLDLRYMRSAITIIIATQRNAQAFPEGKKGRVLTTSRASAHTHPMIHNDKFSDGKQL